MIRQIILLISIFQLNNSFSQECKDARTGVFQFDGLDGSSMTIIRTKDTQYESSTANFSYSTYNLTWTEECKYELTNRQEWIYNQKTIRDTLLPKLTNEIFKFEKPSKYYVRTFVDGQKDTVITIMEKLDTSEYYNYILEDNKYKEYEGSKEYFQTQVKQKYGLHCYQSTLDKTKYILLFEKTYQSPLFNKIKIIDSLTFYLKPNEEYTYQNCRYKNEYDDFIFAIYVPDEIV